MNYNIVFCTESMSQFLDWRFIHSTKLVSEILPEYTEVEGMKICTNPDFNKQFEYYLLKSES